MNGERKLGAPEANEHRGEVITAGASQQISRAVRFVGIVLKNSIEKAVAGSLSMHRDGALVFVDPSSARMMVERVDFGVFASSGRRYPRIRRRLSDQSGHLAQILRRSGQQELVSGAGYSA